MRASGFAVSNVCGILQRTAERGCPLRVSTNCFNSGIDWRSCPRFDSCGIIVGAVWELSTIFGGAFCRRRRGLLRGVTGFESSLVLAPVLSIILGPVEAVAITLLIGISASIFLIPRYLADYDRDTVLPLSLAGIVFLIPGVLSLGLLPAETMRHVIAGIMIAIALLMQLPHITLRKSRWQPAVAGALGGLIMGATSMGGPPLVLYLADQRLEPRQFKANIVVTVGCSNCPHWSQSRACSTSARRPLFSLSCCCRAFSSPLIWPSRHPG